MKKNRLTYYYLVFLGLVALNVRVNAQEISTPATAGELALLSDCDRLIFQAREDYNRGELESIMEILQPCAEEDDLALSQRRMLYRLLAESHLYTRNYLAASEYARLLTEIDPRLQVYGVSRLATKGKKNLRATIQSSQYVDAPDLLLLIGNLRYHAFSVELFGGGGIDLYGISTDRNASGVTREGEGEWSKAQRWSFGAGAKYESYRFPFSVALRIAKQSVSFAYNENQMINGVGATLSLNESQDWISPELWLGYQFAPKTFPVKMMDFSLNAGYGADILTASSLKASNLGREDGSSWYSGDDRSLQNEIAQKVYFSIFGSIGLEYRLNRFTTFAELQYRHPFIKEYIYDIEAAPYASDVRKVNHVGLRIGVRAVMYSAFYK